MRKHFQETLDEIRSKVVQMGGIASEMVRRAVESVIHGDAMLAIDVISRDDSVDQIERAAMHQTLLAVMQEAPVATDLRFLVSTLGIVSEIEMVADDAVKLARRAHKLGGQFPAEMKVALSELGELSRLSFGKALKLYTDYSPEMAQAVIQGDKEIDKNYKKARARVFDLIQTNPEEVKHLSRTIEVFHALEHVADHAVAIARRMQMVYEPDTYSFDSSELS